MEYIYLGSFFINLAHGRMIVCFEIGSKKCKMAIEDMLLRISIRRICKQKMFVLKRDISSFVNF